MRIHSLQGLRAISIVFVLLAHLSGTHNCFRSRVAESYGNPGVRIFLVLSGYLITGQLLKERERTSSISLRTFYARRAYRIFPAGYVFMAIAIATHWAVLSRANVATALTNTLNYYPHGNHVLGHLWSLGVEEQFYLLWPLCLLLFFRKRILIVAAAIASGPPLRILFWLLWRRAGLEHPFQRVSRVISQPQVCGCARTNSLAAASRVLERPRLPDRCPQPFPSGYHAHPPARDGKALCAFELTTGSLAGRY